MKPFTPRELQELEDAFQKEEFLRKKSSVGGITFHYYIAPQGYLRELPCFALGFSCRNPSDGYLFLIADSVKDEWKPYWMYHVVVEHMEGNADSIHACLNALRKEMTAAGSVADGVYLDARRTFFENLQGYMASNMGWYTDTDIQKTSLSLEFLACHSEKEKKNGEH